MTLVDFELRHVKLLTVDDLCYQYGAFQLLGHGVDSL